MYKTLKDIPNPFSPNSEIKIEKLFIGRDRELERIITTMDNFIQSGLKKNHLIIGGKSIGKSSFLNILRGKLTSKGLLPVSFVLNKIKTEYSLTFFKELVDSILEAGAPNDLLNKKLNENILTQKEIWEEITIFGSDSKQKSDLFLGELFSHALKQNRFDLPVSEVNLIKDFRYLSQSAKNSEYKGIVILIDEFQLIDDNNRIIQIIQRLMEEVEDILFILCGNSLIKTESFEKITRMSEIIELGLFPSYLIRDFIYKPLMYYGFTRDEINEYLDFDSFSYFFKKKEHNPYYVNLILHYAFEKFKCSNREKIFLDSDITNEVINQLKHNAPYHEKITAQLNASSPEQLKALTHLFPFQNINLNDIVLINMAYSSIDDESYDKYLHDIIDDICAIYPLNLFTFELPESIKVSDLQKKENISKHLAAEVKFRFVGDTIDELYMSHLIQTSLNEELLLDTHLSTIEHLSSKLKDFFLSKLYELEFVNRDIPVMGSFSIAEKPAQLEMSSKLLTEKIDLLENTITKQDISGDDFQKIKAATDNTLLSAIPLFLSLFENRHGYYYCFVKAKIRHKVVIFENFIPISSQVEDFMPYYPNDHFSADNFSKYNIEIIDCIILRIKTDVVMFLQTLDFFEMDIMLTRNIINNDFEKAIKILEIQKSFEDQNTANNNIGFVYLCKGDYQLARKYFDKISNKEYVTFCNLAYLGYQMDETIDVENCLKKAEKSVKQLAPAETKFRVMHQILLPIEKRKQLPNNFDLIFDPGHDIIIQGNKALLLSFKKQNYGFPFIKNAKISSDIDEFYKARYIYYLHYNLNDMTNAKKLLDEAGAFIKESKYEQQLAELLALDTRIIKDI